MKTAIFLCDKTGNMARPWAEAGYECWCVDVQHSIRRDRIECGYCLSRKELKCDCKAGWIHYVWGDARSWTPPAEALLGLCFVAAFPPCTDLTCTGARDFQKKRGWMLTDGVQLFDSCLMACEYSGVPFMLENPATSRLNTHRRKPDYTFHPYEYAAYLDDPEIDNTSKKTGLWVGHGFIMPEKRPAPEPHRQDCWMASPGDDRADTRSITPMGFARAVFLANAPHLKQQQAA